MADDEIDAMRLIAWRVCDDQRGDLGGNPKDGLARASALRAKPSFVFRQPRAKSELCARSRNRPDVLPCFCAKYRGLDSVEPPEFCTNSGQIEGLQEFV